MADASIEQQNEQPHDEIKQDSPYLSTTESKQDMADALTSLISTFKDETEQQDQILSQLQNESTNNPNFGKQTHASQWTVNEVCYWLTTIDLLDYTHTFYSSKIDGNILLNDITQNLLINELNVKPIHCSKILREIDYLKKESTNESDANLNEIIATIKKENEVLLTELEKQKTLNAELSSNTTSDFHSIPHINGKASNTNSKSIINTQSLSNISSIVESQNKIIKDLTKQLEKIQNSTDKKIRELKHKNKKLQDGYIKIETHYQTQLEHSRTKSKNLQAQLSNINENNNNDNWNNNISLLWNENENTAKDLENEKEKRMMLELSLKNMQLALNNERQKRKLLESQTSRLTAELTKYLTSIDKNPSNKKERFARFKSIKKRKNTNDKDIKDNNGAIDTNASSAKTGWQKFLNAAGSVSQKMKHKDKDKDNNNNNNNNIKSVKSFHLPKQLSLTNIQQKLRKKSDTQNDINNNNNYTNENKEISDDIEMDIDEMNINNNNAINNNNKHARKTTLGETVLKTFKKIQSVTKAKMEERAIKKQNKKQSMDSIKETDRFYIADNGDVDINSNGNDIDIDNGDINDDNKVNVGLDDDDEYDIDDEDSSAAEHEYQMRKKKISEKHTRIVITKPNRNNVIEEQDSDDSIVIKRDDEVYSPTSMDIQFKPAMEVLKQTHEQDMDTDASF